MYSYIYKQQNHSPTQKHIQQTHTQHTMIIENTKQPTTHIKHITATQTQNQQTQKHHTQQHDTHFNNQTQHNTHTI